MQLNRIFAGHYTEEQRFLLDVMVHDDHQQLIAQDHVLNEVILLPNANPHMIDFEVYIDDVFVCRFVS